MSSVSVQGGNRLYGSVKIGGMKNAALPILFASLLTKSFVVLDGMPNVKDINVSMELLSEMGAKARWLEPHRVEIDARSVDFCKIDGEKVKKLRASSYLLGVATAFGVGLEMPMPGGCNFEGRPLDYHIAGLGELGASVEITEDFVRLSSCRAIGKKVRLAYPSVGATVNLILASCLAKGETLIENAAKEPHVADLCRFLNLCGAKISGIGEESVRVEGVERLYPCEYEIRADMIEAGTYLMMACGCGGEVEVQRVCKKDLEALTSLLESIGAKLYEGEDSIYLRSRGKVLPFRLETAPFPGFATDLQPPAVVLACAGKGVSKVRESVWRHRFQYVKELEKMGAEILVGERNALIFGGRELHGETVEATDLRGGAALVFAGLLASGSTEVKRFELVERGYEDMEEKLKRLGAAIKTV